LTNSVYRRDFNPSSIRLRLVIFMANNRRAIFPGDFAK
jgi:hypothetical protein